MSTRVLIFGTYDGIHEGHRNFFAQARALAQDSYLIVSLARDANVQKIKGHLPRENENARVASMSNEPLVDEVVIGALSHDYVTHIVNLKPDIIALGYDQDGTVYTEALAEKLSQAGCVARIVRCAAFKPEIYKSSKLRR